MAYTYDPIFAADPNNPAMIAKDAAVLIFNPAIPGVAVTVTDPTGSPLPNPITVNDAGFGPAFQHATLDRVGWDGGGYTGFFTSYEGMRQVATDAKAAALAAAANAGKAATDDVAARLAAGEFTGAKGADGTNGANGANGSNVLPTNDAIAQAVTTDGPAKTALNAAYLPKWKATTAYVAGAQVVAPTGETVTAKVDLTSGATFSAASWNFPAAGSALTDTVVALGTSIAAGWVDNNWPALMPAALAARGNTTLTVVNAGVAGNAQSWMEDRIAPLLVTHKPKYVIIETSPNDSRADLVTAQASTLDSLARTITKVRNAGATPIVATAGRFDPVVYNNPAYTAASLIKQESTNVMVRSLCAANNVRMIDMWNIFDVTKTVEGLHPNNAGSAIWAANVADALTSRYAAPSVPGSVVGLTATMSDGIVSLTWDAVTANPAVSNYQVEYKLGTESTWTVATRNTSGLTSYSQTGLVSGTYNFRVSALSWLGDGTPSATATVAVTAAATAVYDTFNRTNTTGPLGTPDIGPTWEANANFGIEDGNAYKSEVASSYVPVVIDSNLTDVKVVVKTPADVSGVTSKNPFGVVVRSTSNKSAYYVFWYDTAWKLYSAPGYVVVPLTQVATPPTLAQTRGKELSVQVIGSEFTIAFDGVVTFTASSTTLTGGTYVGIAQRQTASRTEFFKAVSPA